MNVKRIISWFLCALLFAQLFPLTYAEESAVFLEEPNEESIISEALMGELSVPQAMESLDEERIEESSEGLAEQENEMLSSDSLAGEDLETDNQTEPQSSIEEAPQETEDHNKTITPVCVKFICEPEETVVTVYDPAHLDENGEPLMIEPEEDGSWLLLPGIYRYEAGCKGFETERCPFEVTSSIIDNQIIDMEVTLKKTEIVKGENIETAKYSEQNNRSHTAYSFEYSVLPDSIGLTQQTDVTCTLAAAAMMLRARMYRSSNEKWTSITESSIQSAAWTTDGLKWSWKYSIDGNSMSVSHTTCNGMTISNLKSLLDSHPEGIVLYNRSKPHAVFVCDYVGDTFYCFDPWKGVTGRRTLSSSTMKSLGNQDKILSAIDDYWYVSSYSISPSASYALDLNGFLDGTETPDLGDFCTVDVYINGKLELSGVNDYYKVLPAGTTYEFKNLKVKYGKAYDGVDSGSMGGTLSGYQNVRMVFRTIPDQAYGESFKAGTFNGHTYRYYSTPVTWYEANYYSQKLGGHLVTITSEAENSFVLSLCENSQIHIGMSRGEDGVLRWVTGESMNYTNWKSGEPSNWWGNDERSENYGKFSVDLDGTWNDGAGYFKEGFVCEFDEAPVYTVTLDPNGGYFDKTGSTTPKQISKKPGEELDFTGTEYSVSRQGYVWLGFSLSKTEHIYPENSEFGLWYSEDESVTLYAAWDPVVSYDANGGTGTPARQVKELGSALTLSSTTPTRASSSAGSFTVTLNANGGSISQTSLSAARTTSYTFKNWNTAANGSGTTYNAGASYTADEPATLYAQWNSSTTTAAVNLPSPTRSGYTFQGWATNSGATSGVTGSYTPDGNVTLYAIWKQKNTNGGEIQISGASAAPGNEVILNVNLAKNPGIMLLSFKLSYDESKLQFLGGEDAGLTGWTFSTAGKGVLWDGDKNSTTTGTVAKLRFQVLDSAEDGTTEVNLIEVFAANYDEQEVAIEANSGTVTISRRLPGDATDDGKVNGFDLIRMRKYLAGEPVEINLSNADVTGDGKFNGFDLIRFRKFLAGEAVELK